MPGAVFDRHMVMYAEVFGDLKCAVGKLIHPHGTGCRPVQIQWIPRGTPPPVGARDRIAGPFQLRQCSQQLRCHHRRRMLAKERPVIPPRFAQAFIESVV